MKSKLIIVEGLPGSGKSTTAQFIANQFKRNTYDANWYYEVGLHHPLELQYESCLSEGDYLKLLEDFFEYSSILQEEVTKIENYYFFKYVILDRTYKHKLPKKIIETLEKNDVASLNQELYIKLKLNKWHEFTKLNIDQDQINVIESSFLQAPIVELLLKDYSLTDIKAFIKSLHEQIKPLNPALIYFYQQDIKQAIMNLFQFRGSSFTDYVINLVENSPYGQNRRLKGLDGSITFFTEYRHIADDLFHELEMIKLSIDNTKLEWELYQKQIVEFLQLSYIEDINLPNYSIFEGTYHCDEINRDWMIKEENNYLYLYLNDTYKAKLIPLSQNSFQMESNTINLIFLSNEHQKMDRIMISGREMAGSYGKLGLIFKKL